MLRFILLAILIIVIARIFWRVIDAVIDGARVTGEGRGPGPAVKLVRDPVCGTYGPARTALSATAGGTTHYFCSEDCRAKFTRQ